MNYRIFDGVLRSDIVFPDLPPASPDETPTWTLQRSPGERPAADRTFRFMGEEQVEKDVKVTLTRSDTALRLSFDDTGTFDIVDGGTRILWYPPATPDLEAVRQDVLGRVMAVALHGKDVLTLHGSAVAVSGAGLAFVAPKFHGKSTVAATLVRAGAELLSDDVVAIRTAPAPMVYPWRPRLLVWTDVAARFGAERPARAAGKVPVPGDGMAPASGEGVPLAAVYVLNPAESTAAVKRERISPRLAPLILLAQGKVAGLLGAAGTARLLPGACALADCTPVYRLVVPRDLGRLQEVADRLATWHGDDRNAAGARSEGPW